MALPLTLVNLAIQLSYSVMEYCEANHKVVIRISKDRM